MPVAEKYKVPLLTGVSSKADLTEKGMKYFFRSAETDRLHVQDLQQDPRREAASSRTSPTSASTTTGAAAASRTSPGPERKLGVKTVMKEYFDHGATDFYTLLTKLRAGQADGVFVAAETQDGSILVKQFKELGLNTKVFGVGSWATPTSSA
jgi:branched-chain amino acid transport system substrate-binding protein